MHSTTRYTSPASDCNERRYRDLLHLTPFTPRRPPTTPYMRHHPAEWRCLLVLPACSKFRGCKLSRNRIACPLPRFPPKAPQRLRLHFSCRPLVASPAVIRWIFFAFHFWRLAVMLRCIIFGCSCTYRISPTRHELQQPVALIADRENN